MILACEPWAHARRIPQNPWIHPANPSKSAPELPAIPCPFSDPREKAKDILSPDPWKTLNPHSQVSIWTRWPPLGRAAVCAPNTQTPFDASLTSADFMVSLLRGFFREGFFFCPSLLWKPWSWSIITPISTRVHFIESERFIIDGRMDGRTVGWMDGWMDGWIPFFSTGRG